MNPQSDPGEFPPSTGHVPTSPTADAAPDAWTPDQVGYQQVNYQQAGYQQAGYQPTANDPGAYPAQASVPSGYDPMAYVPGTDPGAYGAYQPQQQASPYTYYNQGYFQPADLAGQSAHHIPQQAGPEAAGAAVAQPANVKIYPPGQLKHYLIGGAMLALGALAFLGLTGRSGDPVTTDEVAITDEAESPEELAFDDLEERVDDLEDDGDVIIIDDDNNGGYYGGGGGYIGGGRGYGNGDGDGIILDGDGIDLDNDGSGIVIEGDDLVVDDGGGEPAIGDGEPVDYEFPSCDVDGHDEDGVDDEDGAGDEDGSDPNDDEQASPDVEFPYTDDFTVGAEAGWSPLGGTWGLTGEDYQQTDPETYGNISQLDLDLPERYSASIDITPLGDAINGGLILGQTTPGERNGATVVDLTDDGTFLRWGHYDEAGEYNYDGGVAVPDGFDPTIQHRFTVTAAADKTTVAIDEVDLADFGPLNPGRMGLFTSASALSFDNLTINSLD